MNKRNGIGKAATCVLSRLTDKYLEAESIHPKFTPKKEELAQVNLVTRKVMERPNYSVMLAGLIMICSSLRG